MELIRPNYYRLKVDVEVMEIIKIVTRNLKGDVAFKVGNVIKYLLRAENKNGIEDYKKALTYLNGLNDYVTMSSAVDNDFEEIMHDAVLKKVASCIDNSRLRMCIYNVFTGDFKLARRHLKQLIEELEDEQERKAKK